MLSFGADSFVFQYAIKNLKIKIFRTKILPVILSLTIKEQRRLRVFEKGMLRRIFGSKRDEVTKSGKDLMTNIT